MSSTTLKPLRIGTLLLSSGVQFIDAATTDLFGMLDPSYLTASNLPPPIVALGIPVSIIYINSNSDNDSSDPTIKTTPLTGSATLQTTASITTPSTQPGSLDILLIPGGEPTAEISKEVTSFIRSHVLGGTVVLSICTGMYQLSSTGLLDGRRATAPRALLPWFRERYPATEWVDRRWVADGNVWSSGAISNGMDMAAAFLREKYPGPLSELVCKLADVGDRGDEYGCSEEEDAAMVAGAAR